ncbi:MAG: hypothetical protein M3Z04_13410, partial [Chloroflexota bacterium]|nr:hypothetical protein [Chloroflexota bacterium]
MNDTQLRGPRRCVLSLLLALAVSGCAGSAGGAVTPTVVGAATAAGPVTAMPVATDAPATAVAISLTVTPAGEASATSPPPTAG